MRPPRRPMHTLAAILLTAAAAAGQDRRPESPALVEMAEEPLRLEAAGIAVSVPVGAITERTKLADKVSTVIAAPDSTWRINIETPHTSNLAVTSAQAAEGVLTQLLASYGIVDAKAILDDLRNSDGVVDPAKARIVESKAQLVQWEQALDIVGAPGPASRFYLRTPPDSEGIAMIRGFTALQAAPGRFVTFELLTPESQFAASRHVYETVVASAHPADVTAVQSDRGVGIELGVSAMNALAEAHLDAAIAANKERWERLFIPGQSGAAQDDTEVGYRRVSAWKGKRGQIDPDRSPARWTVEERQEGYLLSVEYRYLDAKTRSITDSQGIFFMTPDRRDEAWQITMTVRDEKSGRRNTYVEVGARSGPSMSVKTTGMGQSTGSVPTVPSLGYVSQFESLLLPQLLVRTGAAPGEYAFYAYNSTTGTVSLRRDTIAQTPAGTWKFTVRQQEDKDPFTTFLSDRAEPIRTELPDGKVWQPIEFDRLLSIWKSKNMPLK